jgi:3-hydroxyacyl-CoA dehydrogenase
VVFQNGPENQELKTRLIAELDAHAQQDVVIASSSSGLPASQFIAGCKVAPQRVLVAHPFNPPHLMPLIEIVPHPDTDQDTIKTAMSFYLSLNKKPVLIKREVPGFAANRLQAAINNEAYSLVSRGVLSARDLDTVVTTGPGLRWALNGPLITNTLGGGGGKNGFSQRLQRLGPGIRVWEEDMVSKRFSWTQSEQDSLQKQIDRYLDDVDLPETASQRDRALLELLRMKDNYDVLI